MLEVKEHRKGTLAIFIAALLWSTGGVFIKLLPFTSMQISALRGLFTALTFIAIYRSKLLRVNKFTVVNALCYSGILILFVAAVKLTTVANAIFLQYTAPIYVLIFEPILNKTRYEKINIISIVFCFFGMSLFFMGELSTEGMLGNILALISGLLFAAFLLGMRKNKDEYQGTTIFLGNVFIFLICLYSLPDLPKASFINWLEIFYLGVFQIGVAYAVFSYGLKKVLAIEASLISMIEPVLNPIWTLIGYGEVPSFYAIIGGVIILITIGVRTFIVERQNSKPIEPDITAV